MGLCFECFTRYMWEKIRKRTNGCGRFTTIEHQVLQQKANNFRHNKNLQEHFVF